MQKIVVHANFAKGFRGGERQTQLLVENLSLLGYKQKLIVRKNSELTKRCKNLKNLEIIEISKPYVLHINKIKDASIIHAHETKAAQFVFLAHLFYKIPYIITRRVANTIKKNIFTKAIYDNASAIVVLSNAIKQEVQKISQNKKIFIIPSAISNLLQNQDNINKIKCQFENKFVIGNIGELEASKGQNYLIDAAKELIVRYPNIHIVFLGKGDSMEAFKKQTQPYENFSFEGFVDNVGDYLGLFDLFVFPTLKEGLGSILLDVMQANIPIIASNTGGIPDIIEHNKTGLLFEPANVQELVKSIEILINNRDLAEFLTKNAKESVGNYSKENMAKRYVNIYDEILKGRDCEK